MYYIAAIAMYYIAAIAMYYCVFSVGGFKRLYDSIQVKIWNCLVFFFYISTNTTLNRLRFGNSYSLSAFDE